VWLASTTYAQMNSRQAAPWLRKLVATYVGGSGANCRLHWLHVVPLVLLIRGPHMMRKPLIQQQRCSIAYGTNAHHFLQFVGQESRGVWVERFQAHKKRGLVRECVSEVFQHTAHACCRVEPVTSGQCREQEGILCEIRIISDCVPINQFLELGIVAILARCALDTTRAASIYTEVWQGSYKTVVCNSVFCVTA
jgi:hypothetical protein